MIIEIILLVLIILNLGFISLLAFLGKKEFLLVFSIIEAFLGFLFAYIVTFK